MMPLPFDRRKHALARALPAGR